MRSNGYSRILVPFVSQPQGFGIRGKASRTLHICLSQPQTVHSQEPSFESTGSSSPKIPGMTPGHRGTAGSTRTPVPWGRQAGREGRREGAAPTATPDLVAPAPVPRAVPAPQCSQSVSPQPLGLVWSWTGGWAERTPQPPLCPPPPVRLKPSPGFLLEQQPGTAWPGLGGGPSARPRIPRSPFAPAGADQRRPERREMWTDLGRRRSKPLMAVWPH